MAVLKILLLFGLTAICEIIACFLPYLWLRKNGSVFLLIPTALILILFVWLLSLHPQATGRIYATYGGIYVVIALLWLRYVDKVNLNVTDWLGAAVVLLGALIMLMGWSIK